MKTDWITLTRSFSKCLNNGILTVKKKITLKILWITLHLFIRISTNLKKREKKGKGRIKMISFLKIKLSKFWEKLEFSLIKNW